MNMLECKTCHVRFYQVRSEMDMKSAEHSFICPFCKKENPVTEADREEGQAMGSV
jgi:Zn finger protein HypA/HybF involved in hydrogenase expression